MPVKPLRRLSVPVNESLYDRIRAQYLHSQTWRPEADIVERDHPDLIIRDGDNLVAAAPGGGATATVLYAFDNERVFRDRFPAMFEKLLPRVRKTLGAESVRLRLAYAPARPVVEPVLRKLWFTPRRDWLSFTLDKRTKLPAAPAPAGVKFRDATLADELTLVRIDGEAFPESMIDPGYIRDRLKSGSVIVATAGKEIAGFCLFEMRDVDAGWISVLAVAPAHQGRGIGAALTTRGAKRLFAQGATRVGLTTDETNFTAMRLYTRLGFRQTDAGRDYTRPTNPKAIEKLKTDNQGTFIKFGGWR